MICLYQSIFAKNFNGKRHIFVVHVQKLFTFCWRGVSKTSMSKLNIQVLCWPYTWKDASTFSQPGGVSQSISYSCLEKII